jgi:hypothetical protein
MTEEITNTIGETVENPTFWQIITGHRAIFAYVVILLSALILLMLLFIIRNAKETALREREKKQKQLKRRFSRLSAIDDAQSNDRGEFENGISLNELCEKFRDFASSRMGLYYDIEVVRAFVASLSVTKLIIMQGISGTGKTSLAYAFGKFIGHEASIVPVQPSWKDRTDMLGYYNEFTGNFTETELLYNLYEANGNDKIYLTVLDEMNIARVEYYFAEFLSVLELPDLASRKIEVVSDIRENDPNRLEDGKLTVPDNMWFVGTANNDDSTLSISDKVYDRAMVIELQSRAKQFTAPDTEPVSVSSSYLFSLFARASHEFAMSDEIRMKTEQLDRYISKHLQITFGNRILRQTEKFIPVYRACGGTEAEAVDLILSKKVLRKLEAQNPVYVAAEAEGVISAIESIFGEGALPGCVSYMKKFVKI